MYVIRGVITGLVIGLLFGCSPEPKTLFTQLEPSETGIDFQNTNHETEEQNILSYEYFYNGGGVAVGDINNDGLVDIFFSSNQGDNKLYLNKGDLKFEDITQRAGFKDNSGWKTGVSMADINGDGLLDIYVCRSGNEHELRRFNSAYINKGNLTFEDQASSLGVADKSYTTQAAFFDFDNDHDLDLFLLNHSRLQISNSFDITRRFSTKRIPHVGNRLLKNENGKFFDVSDTAGIYGPASNYGLGVVISDFDNDGFQDIYTSNDYTEKDKIYSNRNFHFVDISDSLLSHMSQFSMGVDVADINNDGLMDIVTVDMLPESNQRQKEFFWPDKYDVYAAMVNNGRHHQYMRNMLHLNNGNGTYSEIGQLAGISNTDWSWAPLFADFDNDGLQDLFVSNGFKRNFTSNDFLKYRADLSIKAQRGQQIGSMDEILKQMPRSATHDYIFQNKNGLLFQDVSIAWGFSEETLSSGTAYTDLDNDGDLDLVVNRMDATAGVYRNNSNHLYKRHFLKVHLRGAGKNTFGVGAKVTLYLKDKKMVRELSPCRGFQSSVEPALFFGLGDEVEIDSLIVEWPGGTRQNINELKSDQTLTLRQTDAISFQRKSPVIAVRENRLPYFHAENKFIDFKVQPLLPRMYSTHGPALAVSLENESGNSFVFMGGAKGQKGQLFIVDKNKDFRPLPGEIFEEDRNCEDVDAIFFDMDADGDEDLYVVSGGYEYDVNDKALQDRLYENNSGKFRKVGLPDLRQSGSCVRSVDFDEDGDLDLFIGSRLLPGRYPEIPTSIFLENKGKGDFVVNTSWLSAEEAKMGLVTDAKWIDINNDKASDLVVVGEWMPVTIFIQENGKLVNKTTQHIKESSEGWWNCIESADLDGDGDLDLIVGNFGMNNQYKPTLQKPVKLYYDDFDKNGSLDLLLNYYIQDKLSPFATRDELTDQIPGFKKRFPDYAKYTRASIESLLTPDELSKARVLEAGVFETSVFVNENGSYVRRTLPSKAQAAPVFDILCRDFNNDGILDIMLGGNISAMGSRFGRSTGLGVTILNGDGKNTYSAMVPGFFINADVRQLKMLDNNVLVGLNNAPLGIVKPQPVTATNIDP